MQEEACGYECFKDTSIPAVEAYSFNFESWQSSLFLFVLFAYIKFILYIYIIVYFYLLYLYCLVQIKKIIQFTCVFIFTKVITLRTRLELANFNNNHEQN